jgi:hypothetical protein
VSFSIKYFSLDKTLFFNATIVVKERVGDVESMFTYTYDINIGWAGHKSGWDYVLFVQKQNPALSPSTGNLADILIAELGEPANYIEITIYKNAQKKLSNVQDVIDKWQVKYKQLMHTYQGKWAEAIIDRTTNAYKNGTAILKHFITKDWILNTYFMGIYDVTFDYSGRSTNNQHLLHNALGNTICQFNERYRYSKTAEGCTIGIHGNATP